MAEKDFVGLKVSPTDLIAAKAAPGVSLHMHDQRSMFSGPVRRARHGWQQFFTILEQVVARTV
jgi:hypothetical protein